MAMISNSIMAGGILSVHSMKPSNDLLQITKLSLHPSSSFAIVQHHDQGFFSISKQRLRYRDNIIGSRDNKIKRSFVVYSVVQPGGMPPSEPPFNFLKWMVGVFVTVVLPFLGHKWGSLLKIKNEIETAVETIEEITEAVENVADGVEKLAEDIADDLPEGERLRKAVDFIENVAERASNDAHMVGEFIDKVQEAEEKVESIAEEASHRHPKELDHRTHNEENEVHEPFKEANDEKQI